MAGKGGRAGGLDAQLGAEHHDGDLDEEFGTAGVTQPVGEARRHVADEQAHDKGKDQTGFRTQTERPGDALLFQLGGVGRDVGVGPHGIAGHGDEEDHREAGNKTAHIAVHQLHAETKQRRHKDIGGKERAHTGDDLAGGIPALERVTHPHAHLQRPAKRVDADELAQGKDEDNGAQQQGDLIFVECCFRCHRHLLQLN